MTEVKKQIIVGRPINGCWLNDLEYLLDGPDGDIMKFKSVEDAKDFLVKNGCDDPDFEDFVFEEVEE